MDFIDLFDFSKYFKRDGDGKRAKIGHVNAIIEEIGFTETVINISSAEILALGTSGKELLPSLDSGKYYEIDTVRLEYTYGTVAYSSNAQELMIYGNYVEMYVSSTFLEAGDNTQMVLKTSQTGDRFLNPITGIQNVYLAPADETTNPTLGDGTLRVIIKHKIITFGE